MKKQLTHQIAIISRTGKKTHIYSIDLEAKIVTLNTDKGLKDITFTTALSYKLTADNAHSGETLTEAILTHLLAAENPPKEEPEESTTETNESEEVPYGTVTTVKPNSENKDLFYIPDLAEKIGCTQKNIRKRLRKLESLEFIVKTNHTWCWDATQFETVVGMLEDRVDSPEDKEETK
jgi:biotin operon repressor